MSEPGTTFARAFAAKDRKQLLAVLAPELDFRAMTPGRFWEARTADEVLDILLANWLEPADEVVALEHVESGAVGTRHHVTYRMRLRNPDGEHLMEQRAYFQTESDRLSWMRIMCSGFIRV